MVALILFIGFGCWMDNTGYTEMANSFQDWDEDGFTPNDGDCDDSDPMLHPEADEICDGRDNDCNDIIDDEPINGSLFYYDSDSDGCTESIVLSCAPINEDYMLEPEGC